MRVVAARQEGFGWVKREGVYAKGYLFDGNLLLRGEELALRVAALNDLAAFEEFILTANGSFALLVNRSELHVAAVDRLRSIPLFYARSEDMWVVGDDAEGVREAAGLPVQSGERSLQEFALAGFVLGAETLISGLYQIRAGERVVFSEDGPLASYYYIHRGTVRDVEDETTEFDRLDVISKNWGKRLVQSAESRPLLLPLSGGYDSRYVAAVLRELEYPNLVAYTYGRPDSPEVVRSQKVAQQLDMPWYYVEYTEEAYRNFLASESHERYCTFAHQRSSLPHYQDFLALQELTNRGVIDSDAIVVPGFCGDLLGGSYVPREVLLGREEVLLAKGIVRHIDEQQLYLKLFLCDRCPEQVREHIAQEVERIGMDPTNVQDFVSHNDAFFTVHKVAKYVVHSLRVYEYFGLEWRMPLWDNELMNYWYQVPYEYRSHVNLYERYLFERPFKRLGIAFTRPPGEGLARFHRAVVHIPGLRRYPKTLEHIVWGIHRRVSRKDLNAFNAARNVYLRDLRLAGMPRMSNLYFLGVFARWYLWTQYRNEMALRYVR